ncbi:aspartate aminotransferase family protein [Crenobacter cavernae]|uniref:Aspartate aminotransferase family protein n=1 Tax=Crenobacter cavernae TaxID=2290923 RepID=A0ABY0FG76_9NEIS|nr:aspartate aminotransferase family protein [Crenobacter cavernae]RXZ45395.1 aspartate aminotransferase family protein [Crenobacter cavernae]
MPLDRHAIHAVAAAERQRFADTHPASQRLAQESRGHFLAGVPMHWMSDWGTPFPLFVEKAQGVTLTDADGRRYTDFCLGDTGAMFGHSPAPVAEALAAAAGRGLTSMLPSPDAPVVGRLLAERFGLPVWQLTATATDANRAAIRWARALTGRSQVLVFNGCYHGTVDDTFVRLKNGRAVHRPGLIGQQADLTRHTVAVEFNDLAALEAALSSRDVACVLTEPALTNCGMVLPRPGFLNGVRELTRRYGTLLILDETHTLSSAPGGWVRQAGIAPDMLTVGKAIAGGLPVAVYGMSAAVAILAEAYLARKEPGHSGLGTTLSANLFSLAALRANLEAVATDAAYQHMTGTASYLGHRLSELFALHHLPWCVTQIGARCEFQFAVSPPANGREAEAAMDPELEHALHLFLLNRGVAITPFHNMMLCAPATTRAHVDTLVTTLEAAIAAIERGVP